MKLRDIRVTKLVNGSTALEVSGEYQKPEGFPQQFAIGEAVTIPGYRANKAFVVETTLELVEIPGSILHTAYWRRTYVVGVSLHYGLTNVRELAVTEADLLEMNPREPTEAVLLWATYPLTHMSLISMDTTKPVLGKATPGGAEEA